jgi:hypothetical protein
MELMVSGFVSSVHAIETALVISLAHTLPYPRGAMKIMGAAGRCPLKRCASCSLSVNVELKGSDNDQCE